MFYPEEFKKLVRETYPRRTVINELLESGSRCLGNVLADEVPAGMPYDTVLSATSLEELKKIAEHNKKKRAVYEEWLKIDQGNRQRIYRS